MACPIRRLRDIGADEYRGHSPIQPINEHIVIKRAINHWTPPKLPTQNLSDARLNSFKNWPRGSPTPESLSEAGFFSNGTYIFTKFYSLFSFQIFCFTYSQNFVFTGRGDDKFAFIARQAYTSGYLQTMCGRNTHAAHLSVYTSVTSKAPRSFVKVDDWDPHKIKFGKKVFLYVI